jgi:hypothetical protein
MWPDLEVHEQQRYTACGRDGQTMKLLMNMLEVASKSICQSFAIAGVLIKISKNQHSDIDLEKRSVKCILQELLTMT